MKIQVDVDNKYLQGLIIKQIERQLELKKINEIIDNQVSNKINSKFETELGIQVEKAVLKKLSMRDIREMVSLMVDNFLKKKIERSLSKTKT